MIHNGTLRRLRYALKLNDQKVQSIFALAGHKIDLHDVSKIMLKEDEAGFRDCTDVEMCAFLDGLIISRRGQREGEVPKPLAKGLKLNNNEVLCKIRIALELKDQDMQDALKQVNFLTSKGELSALFRKHGHRNYKACGDQLLRHFLNGLVATLRGKVASEGALDQAGSEPRKNGTSAGKAEQKAEPKPAAKFKVSRSAKTITLKKPEKTASLSEAASTRSNENIWGKKDS